MNSCDVTRKGKMASVQFCAKGHITAVFGENGSHGENLPRFCPACGNETLCGCPHCKAKVMAKEGHLGWEFHGTYCDQCGKGYPWMNR
jgi:hypothetical protein